MPGLSSAKEVVFSPFHPSDAGGTAIEFDFAEWEGQVLHA